MKCRALLDTGAGSSYASAALLNLLQVRPDQRQVRQIERMLGAATKKVEIFKSHFLRISRIERHSQKIEFFFILPKHPFG